ncbi:GPI-GlcNAc transferase complex, PIG-H component-domain-containing protein [Lipomyces kononenkoae]|uniref:GPI-GlcNAc transferase complex, PIG-H component-domain-containing protein n=1 Tax=Lipomyces kononenkoae TaxID=34357 RepID=A0ACC3SW15_LIPKO
MPRMNSTTTITSRGLTVRRMTPTTTAVKYTISNKPTGRTLGPFLLVGFRIICALFFLSLLLRRVFPLRNFPLAHYTIHVAKQFTIFTSGTKSSIDIALIFGAVLLGISFLPREYTEESVLVLHNFGIQVSSTGRTRLSRTSQFIPLELIQDVVLNEGFRGFSVIYYLAVVVKGRGRLLVVFPNLLPPREILEEIWRDIRACMHQHPVSLSVGTNTYIEESK